MRVAGWARIALTVLVVCLVFGWALPRHVDYEAVRDTVVALDAGALGVLALLGLLWTGVDSLVFTCAIPGLGLGGGYRAWLASNAVAGLVPAPADLAVRLGIYATYGVDAASAASGVLLAGIVTTAVKTGIATVALVVLTATGATTAAVRPLALGAVITLCVGALVVVGVVHSDAATRGAGRLVERTVNVVALRWLRREVTGLPEQALVLRRQLLSTAAHRWPLLVTAAVAAEALLAAALVLSVRFVGVPASLVGTTDLLLAYAVGVVATLLPWLRSGLGTSELLYVVVLAWHTAGVPADAVVAGAFAQRVFTWLVPVVLGFVVLLGWVRGPGRALRHGGRRR